MATQQQRDAQLKRDRYASNPDVKERDALRRRARQKERYQNDPEFRAKRILASTERKRFAEKGVTASVFQEALTRTGYKCEGCETAVDWSSAHIDHDHDTGKFRGILCIFCNIALNHKMTPKILRRLAEYLER